MDNNIRVGISHGDPNGVGYEVILKTLAEEGVAELFTPVIFGHSILFEKAINDFGIEELPFHVVKDPKDIMEGSVNLVEINEEVPEIQPGMISKVAGLSAVNSLKTAVDALKRGEIDVLVTAPISKEAVQSEEFHFPGHTEFLSREIGEGNEAMMILCNDYLRVALLTVHMPVSKISENITEEKIINSVEVLERTLKRDFGIPRPSIAVLSLNPHAGDGGLLGEEEEKIISPALASLVDRGILAYGPFAADGFFGHGVYKHFDGILAMYHDQGLAPFKTLASTGGVNFSANLPYVRTSPDHGTAFDIAWKGEADPASMRDAIYLAIDIFRRRKIYDEISSNPLKKFVHERPEKTERFDKNHNKGEINRENND